jgi:distribution and morphology protein 31
MQPFMKSAANGAIRPINFATIQRYKTIRTFFKRQHAQSLVPRPPSVRQRYHTQTAAINVGLSSINNFNHLRGSLGLRAFGSSSIRQNTRKPIPPSSPRINQDTRETTEGSSLLEGSPTKKDGEDEKTPESHNLEDYSRFYRRLALSLPPMRRPTRDELLKVATGFWQRLRIRFKWFTIRSFRRFNADDMSAFFTWFLMSQTLWILVGT